MACTECDSLNDITDLSRPYVVRTCKKCGREIKLRSPGAHGIGIKIRKGDRFVMPAGFLNMSANPLKSGGQFTSHGLKRFAEMVFGVDIAKREHREDFPAAIRAIMDSNESFFKDADYLKGLDLNEPANEEEMFKRISANAKTVEWWGYMAAGFGSIALNAIEEGNASEAAWAMATAERFRALAIFKSAFEEAVFIGQSARRLIDLIRTWDSNKENGDEGFWQIKLRENAYAVSQVFSVPVTLIQGRAYVGGMSLDGTDARFLDFLFSGGSANDAILVEIKTPTTKLLGARYRKNVYPPSAALGGSVVQVNDYCQSLRQHLVIAKKADTNLNTFNPRRIVIIGHYEKELTDSKKKTSFELFRSSLSGIDVITFDEFFRKIEHLAKLFNLVRTMTSSPEEAPASAPQPTHLN
jgi:Domain of unknown function (DUF4263)